MHGMKAKILKLSSKTWRKHAVDILEILKPEIFGNYGGEVVAIIREIYDTNRLQHIEDLRNGFLSTANISNMDEKVNDLTLGLLHANNEPNDHITYDFLNYVYTNSSSLKEKCPNCIKISKLVFEKKIPDVVTNLRIISIVNALVYKSVAQSGRSNAGNAGEFFVSAVFDAIGLKQDTHYKSQHKSRSGSDTDFVLPYVENNQDQNIEVCCAVQFSSNDRFRMIDGELKSGSKFAITGNGLDASSKTCDDIGLEIIVKARQSNYLLVCYSKEKARMIKDLTLKSQKTNKNGKLSKRAIESKDKLDFFQNNCKSFSEFAKDIKTRFAGR